MPVFDNYSRYYSEKLWAMIPEVYHAEDAAGAHPNVLRQIVELIAEQAAHTRRSIDRLWEDQHIDTCDDWAVPYIADLVGTRLLPAIDSRARRVDVARTVHFRRRRGTPSLLEQLVRELSGWDVVLVEAFRRLGRSPHRLDSFPLALGTVTGTPAGGTANLRNGRGAELAPGPFDEFFRTPDIRRLRGAEGRYAIGKINFHFFRTTAFELNLVTPRSFTSGSVVTFTFDPSGRDVPLFSRSLPVTGGGLQSCQGPWGSLPASGSFVRTDDERCDARCTVTHQWQVAQPIPCRLLSEAKYRFTLAEALAKLSSFTLSATEAAALRTLSGFEFVSEARLRRRLTDLGVSFTPEPAWYRELLKQFVTADSAKPKLVPNSVSVRLGADELDFTQVTGGDLSSLACQNDPSDPEVRLLVDPARGRFSVLEGGEPLVQRYFYGFVDGIGAGGYTRELPDPDGDPIPYPPDGEIPGFSGAAVMTLNGSRSYELRLDSSTPITNAVLQADQRTRPYVLVRSEDVGSTSAADLTPSGGEARLRIDGIWIGTSADTRHELVVRRASPAGDFDWEEIVISNSTIDPGGVRADGTAIGTVAIVVASRVKLLRIVGSITGPIRVLIDSDPDQSGFVERIEIVNSIVDATQIEPDSEGKRMAISNAVGEVHLSGVTVFGDVQAERIFATNSLVMGELFAIDSQNSCFRFGAARPGDEDRLPQTFPPRSVSLDIRPFYFVSMRFGDPGYAALSAAAPEALFSGAEDGSEIGAFSFLRRPIRMNSVATKVDEFKPIAVMPQFIFEGESATGVLAAE
jgi:hypothetical protein